MKTKIYFKKFISYLMRADIILWIIMLSISAYSLILLSSVSVSTGTSYFRTQLLVTIAGLVIAVFLTFMDYADIANLWKFIAFFSVTAMLYTQFFGETIAASGGVNATAWIVIGDRTFQTSELVKILFIITFSKHLDIVKKKGMIDSFPQILLIAVHAFTPILLCHFQGDDGAGIVFLAIFIFMSLSAGIKLRYFAILGAIALISIPILWNFVMAEYQRDRFTAVFNLDDPTVALDAGYQQFQGRISIGSGQFSGQGLYNGRRVASNLVTFQQSDFIFSVAGEELGFLGCLLIIFLLLLYMLKILHVARCARDDLGRFICFGFFGLIALQSVSNIGMCLALLPVMGVTLPFFSAGGSSAICLYLGFGLVQSVYMRRKESDGVRLRRTLPMKLGYKQIKKI